MTNRPIVAGFEHDSPDEHGDEPPEFISQPADLDSDSGAGDDESYGRGGDEAEAAPVPRKKGGYDSRIEQILYEHSDLEIVITDAGKSVEGGGSYIVYTIRTGVSGSESKGD